MSDIGSIKSFIAAFATIHSDEWTELESLFEFRSLKRGEHIVKEGQFYTNEVFIVEGLVRGYYINDEMEEINITFYQGPDTIAPCFSHNISGRNTINYQVLTDSRIIEFDAEKFNGIIRKYEWARRFAYAILERELLLNVNREKNLLNKNAAGKYLFFKETYPGIETKISQIHVASYLGISPVSLSRLKSNMN
jgi:CRP-like cAMP-binding protein